MAKKSCKKFAKSSCDRWFDNDVFSQILISFHEKLQTFQNGKKLWTSELTKESCKKFVKTHYVHYDDWFDGDVFLQICFHEKFADVQFCEKACEFMTTLIRAEVN